MDATAITASCGQGNLIYRGEKCKFLNFFFMFSYLVFHLPSPTDSDENLFKKFKIQKKTKQKFSVWKTEK